MSTIGNGHESAPIETNVAWQRAEPLTHHRQTAEFILDGKVTQTFKNHLAALIGGKKNTKEVPSSLIKEKPIVSSSVIKSHKLPQEQISERASFKQMLKSLAKEFKRLFISSELETKIDSASLPVLPKSVEKMSSDLEELALQNAEQDEPQLKGPVDQGRIIADEFKDRQGRIYNETAERAETVDIMLKGLRTELATLVKGTPEYQTKEAQIKKYEQSTEGATWGSTNSPRFIFKNRGKVGAKATYAPIAGNLRLQKVIVSEMQPDGSIKSVEKGSFSRSGALCDFSHAESNLKKISEKVE